MASAGDSEDAELEDLMKEHAALQAENEALKLEIRQNAISFDSDEEVIEPTAEEQAAKLQVQLEALKREREALQNVVCLGDELKGLQRTNSTLREATKQLSEENSRLHASSSPAVGSRAAAARPPAGEVALDALDGRVQTLITSLGHGKDILATCGDQKRKEIVAAMLRKGLLDPLGTQVAAAPPVPPGVAGVSQVPPPGKATQAAKATAATAAPRAAAPPRVQVATNLTPEAPWPVSMGPGQDVAEAIRRGDSKALNAVSSEQKKELIANMLKTGLFCAPPGTIHATAADEHQMEHLQEINLPEATTYSKAEMREMKEAQMKTLLTGLERPAAVLSTVDTAPLAVETREERRFAQELALRDKLQGISAAQR